MQRAEVLGTAANLIANDRAEEYGDARESLQSIADIWTVILRRKGYMASYMVLTAHDAALCLAGMKLAREAGKPKADNCVDAAGYFALAAEVAIPRREPA